MSDDTLAYLWVLRYSFSAKLILENTIWVMVITNQSRKIQPPVESISLKERLADLLLNSDLDFHDQVSRYASHNFHAFPAKFPPQLPGLFIDQLTNPGDLVLDPMQGSGTAVLEAYLSGRRGVGFDIDPLAIAITQVKTTPLDAFDVLRWSKSIRLRAAIAVESRSSELFAQLDQRWDPETRAFINYWFDTDTQIELMALLMEIERLSDASLRNFFKMAISGIIITKSGGVSLALDLAHTRPHRARLIYSRSGEVLEGGDLLEKQPKNLRYVTKTVRSPLEEFDKRVQNNLKGLLKPNASLIPASVLFGNAQDLPLPAESVDLIVTSPPYASNAIDYMRAHKFSLVWLGYSIGQLSDWRKKYIGGEVVANSLFEELPAYTTAVVADVSRLDAKKGQVLQRYYSEMKRVLNEMYRVLKPGKVAVVVVGNSDLRGRDTETQNCLADIGRAIGFDVPAIGVRNLDRNRRMLPAGETIDRESQIQKRMHQEFVIGYYKPK